MSSKTITRFILVCDGCGTETTQYANGTEARAIAYNEGWRFPSTITSTGRPAGRASDVCPKCIDDWTPRLNKTSAAWTDERKAEHGETMRRYAERNRNRS
jgi:hypothetical protein